MIRPLPILLCCMAAASVSAKADDADAVESEHIYIPAKIVERPGPKYPGIARAAGREAWVLLEYCIDESGTPRNVAVLDATGNKAFERAAIETVSQWHFEPALIDGKPAWQSNNQQIISFTIENRIKGASPRIAGRIHRLGQLIDAGKLDEANVYFQELLDKDSLNLYELAKIWSQKVRLEAQTGDFHKLYLALHRATASHGEWIDEGSYLALLGIRVRVALQLGNYSGALSAYHELADKAGANAATVLELQPTIQKLQGFIEGDVVLETPGEIRTSDGCYGCNDSFFFSPVRRNLAIADVSGSLRSIEMRCDRQRFESAIAEPAEWHIPESWGSCSIHIYGEPGTTFTIRALPDA